MHRLQDCFLPISESLLDLLRSWPPLATPRTLKLGFSYSGTRPKDGTTCVYDASREECLEFMRACAQPLETVSQEGAYTLILYLIYGFECLTESSSWFQKISCQFVWTA